MSNFVKSNWIADANSIHLSMPIAKIDTEQRLVSGFATLDNVDSQKDIVLSDASVRAFDRARGNLREMHQPIAAGHIVDFHEDEFYDSADQKFYRGVFVTAYVSRGAESTWEKVLDGTLTGFSIGGNILEADSEFVAEVGAVVRIIKEYDLVELSLVDNPANQLANIFSITKSATGSVTVKGLIVDTEIENVFWCKDHPTALKAVSSDTAECIECGHAMESIGWFETGVDRAEKVRDVVNKFLSLNDANAAVNSEGEGGVDEVSKINKSADEPVEEAGTEEATEEEVAEVEAVVEPVEEEETVTPVEVPDEQEAIAKQFDQLHSEINDSLEKTRNETTEKVAALEAQIAEIKETFTAKTSEIESKFNEFGEELKAAKSRFAEFEKALEIVNSAEAVKKSGEIETAPERVQKTSIWNGAFSVDNLLK